MIKLLTVELFDPQIKLIFSYLLVRECEARMRLERSFLAVIQHYFDSTSLPPIVYSNFTRFDVKRLVRNIISSSRTDEEIRERIGKELNYPYPEGIDIHSHIPSDTVGFEARALVRALGGPIRGDGAMISLMMWGPDGETLSI